MDQELSKKITALEEKTQAVYVSVEKMRNYFKWTLIVTIAMIVLPLIGLVFAIPSYMSTLSQYSNLGL